MFCSFCGAEVGNGEEYCSKCGKKLLYRYHDGAVEHVPSHEMYAAVGTDQDVVRDGASDDESKTTAVSRQELLSEIPAYQPIGAAPKPSYEAQSGYEPMTTVVSQHQPPSEIPAYQPIGAAPKPPYEAQSGYEPMTTVVSQHQPPSEIPAYQPIGAAPKPPYEAQSGYEPMTTVVSQHRPPSEIPAYQPIGAATPKPPHEETPDYEPMTTVVSRQQAAGEIPAYQPPVEPLPGGIPSFEPSLTDDSEGSSRTEKERRKKIILWSAVAGGVLFLIVIAVIVIAVVLNGQNDSIRNFPRENPNGYAKVSDSYSTHTYSYWRESNLDSEIEFDIDYSRNELEKKEHVSTVYRQSSDKGFIWEVDDNLMLTITYIADLYPPEVYIYSDSLVAPDKWHYNKDSGMLYIGNHLYRPAGIGECIFVFH